MTALPVRVHDQICLSRNNLQAVLDALLKRGYRVLGPVFQDEAITLGEIANISELPVGWSDEQKGGHYRLNHGKSELFFNYTVGPQSWKRFLHPPVTRLWSAKRDGKAFVAQATNNESRKMAFLGVRPCELHALGLLDRVLQEGEFRDPDYVTRRKDLFIIAVNCGRAGGTCFCSSMETGPEAFTGFDLSITEVLQEERHFFVVRVGSEDGAKFIEALPHKKATKEELAAATQCINDAKEHMGRHLNTMDLKGLLYRNVDNSHWEEVAERCLNCANCTMVCPTCFCTSVEDVTDLSGQFGERVRRWDSCFTSDFSYIHGGSVRASAKSRYRHWLTHKLAYWVDQFGSFGCVGCGRCITWCPVGIDLTDEIRSIREGDSSDTPIPL